MKYPKKELAQMTIAACVANGIEQVVISPGSRNAPLTIGFTNHPAIKTYSIVDERCAAFVALGMAQQTHKPVALVCTSGSALLNYYPAIAEAYYSDMPLVVLSADRPEHLLEIGDGQTIQQENVYGKHSLSSVNLIVGESTLNKNTLDSTLHTAFVEKGPVHINIPFDEPLYETTNTIVSYPKVAHWDLSQTILKETPLEVDELQVYADQWNTSIKKMVLIGTSFPDDLLQTQLEHLLKDPSVLVLTETTSNVNHPNFIGSIDQLLFPLNDGELKDLQPDILLTLGGLVVSKRIKQFLRKYQPTTHWHVNEKRALDTFHCLTRHFNISAQLFFSQFFFLSKTVESTYAKQWLTVKKQRLEKHQTYLQNLAFSDFKVHEIVYQTLPANIQVQLSNSSIVRYGQLFDMPKGIQVFCNRGTSGIDGSTSTAVGAAMAVNKPVLLVTGDISFFYDSNALWNQYIPNSFRIVLINNQGGGIFKFIPGPSDSGAIDYFETPHQLNAENLCKMHNFSYEKVSNEADLRVAFENFYKASSQPKLLEVATPAAINDNILKAYFKNLK